MRLIITFVFIFVLAMAQVSASPRTSAPGDLTVTRTAGGRTTSSHTYREQIDHDFDAFWMHGLPCATLRNLLVLKPRLDTYLYNPVQGGPLGPGGTGAQGYVWAKSKLPISVSRVSCKMAKGSFSGAGAGQNKVAFTYRTLSNYIEGKYTLSRFPVGNLGTTGRKIGYDPVVRTYFDATLHVTLSAPVEKPQGPITATAVSVAISNLKTFSVLRAKDATTIQALVAHLGVNGYDPPGAHWPLVYSVRFPWPNHPSCCFLQGAPFPGWTKWLDSHTESLLSDAVKGFSGVSLMNNFLAESKNTGSNATKLTYASSSGVTLLSSGALRLNTNSAKIPLHTPRR